MDFSASSVEYWTRDGSETVFFGNAEQGLALTLCRLPGAAGHYVEWNDQSNGCTNAVEWIRLLGSELQMRLTAEAAERLGEPQFAIELVCDDDVRREVAQRLSVIFGDRFSAVQRETARPTPPPRPDPGQVKYLNLEHKNLTTLPAYVGEFGALEVAKLAGNPQLDFREVCDVLGKLPALRELSFTASQAVPENIGGLAQLESLTLDGLTAPQALPESIGRLARLRYVMIMSDADVVLPEAFANLRELESLNIRAASWQAPVEIHRLTKLTNLDLANCRFARPPEGMAGMEAVTTVYLAGQSPRDYAQILPIVARMPRLETLQLAGNTVPEEVALCQQIEELVLWGATEIPASIGQMKALRTLVMSLCDFETLPDSIGELTNLTLLNISENPSLRALPESLGQLTELRTLVLEENPQLTSLPDGARRWTQLEQVRLFETNLTNIPESWAGKVVT